ncbi:AHH domain-containing protein [Pyxidicoccus trucidator]|uniref:AHH domain-containing protein n=1 Tax=Pyxidicoccus trucidator TaxID=2709662 RepID=UPI0013DC529D|nr:AHH domain-containing protein [Pyxidicoccus trucidator]
MVAKRLWALLLIALMVGCASPRVVRLETGNGQLREYTPRDSEGSVEVDAEDFEKALARLVLHLPLSLRPSDTGWLVRASTRGSILDRALRSTLHKDYGRWCRAHEGPGDCLSLLENGLGFDDRSRLALALGLSLDPMHESIADAVEETLNPTFFKAVVVSALVSWAILAANPEPVFTKAAAVVAVVMLAYLGVDAFVAIVKACVALKQAADRATTFQELEEAGEHFGQVVGTQGARVFVLAVALVVGKGVTGGTSGLASRLPVLPGFPQAAALSASQLGVNLAAIEQVSAVAVVEGGVAIALAPGAVAMVVMGSDGIRGDPDGKVHHICTDKNTESEVNGGPWTPVFEKLFRRADMTLNDPANLVRIRGHEGPHPEAYHRAVFARIQRALANCRSTSTCREMLVEALKRLSEDLLTPRSPLRRLVTKDRE